MSESEGQQNHLYIKMKSGSNNRDTMVCQVILALYPKNIMNIAYYDIISDSSHV